MLLIQKGKHLNIYNIGTKEKINIRELAKLIAKILSKKILIKYKPLKKGSTKIRVPDNSKIKFLGFRKKISLLKGIKKTILTY